MLYVSNLSTSYHYVARCGFRAYSSRKYFGIEYGKCAVRITVLRSCKTVDEDLVNLQMKIERLKLMDTRNKARMFRKTNGISRVVTWSEALVFDW